MADMDTFEWFKKYNAMDHVTVKAIGGDTRSTDGKTVTYRNCAFERCGENLFVLLTENGCLLLIPTERLVEAELSGAHKQKFLATVVAANAQALQLIETFKRSGMKLPGMEVG